MCAVRAAQTEVLERVIDYDSDYADEETELSEHVGFEKWDSSRKRTHVTMTLRSDTKWRHRQMEK